MIKIVLTIEIIEEIPELPSIYALFSMDDEDECRFVGYTINLKESIMRHFNPCESNMDLRYLMLSNKTKLLYYELEPDGITDETKDKVLKWTTMYNPRRILIRDEKSLDRITNLLNKQYHR